jgi:hypothetical protein
MCLLRKIMFVVHDKTGIVYGNVLFQQRGFGKKKCKTLSRFMVLCYISAVPSLGGKKGAARPTDVSAGPPKREKSPGQTFKVNKLRFAPSSTVVGVGVHGYY